MQLSSRARLLGIAGTGLVTSILSAQTPSSMPSAARAVTFTKDVAPILQRSCQACHRPGAIAPMSFLTFEDVRPWARSIKTKVTERTMPPFFLDRTIGIKHFKNDVSLSDAEIALIARWVDAGAPMGNPGDMPPPRNFEKDAIAIAEPDLIVKSVRHTIPATGSDWWGDYIVETGLTEDRYVKAVETRPSRESRGAVHHAITYLIQDESGAANLEGRGASSDGGFLNEYSAGKNGEIFPDGTGRLMKAGSRIRFNLHYHPYGKEIVDQTEVAIKFYPKGYVPKYYIEATQFSVNYDLDIPAGDSNVRTDSYSRLTRNVRLTSFQPHLHSRGKRMCIEALYPDGRQETLNCTNFVFGWNVNYNYADDSQPLLPAGTIIHIITWHDNGASNRNNPDPTNWVGYGARSIDDMTFAWVNVIWLNDADFKQLVAEREAKTKKVVAKTEEFEPPR